MIIRSRILPAGATLLLLSLAIESGVFAQPGPIAGKYIVVLNSGAAPAAVAAQHGVKADFVYRSALNGLAGAIPPGQLRLLSTPFHKYDHVCGEGFLAQTRRERRAYPSAVCKE